MQKPEHIAVAPACPAPDPNPRKPRFVPPSGATDTHFHILGPAASHPYIEDREYTPPDATAKDYIRLRDTLGLDRAVLVQPSVYGDDNRCMLEAARLLGVPTRMVVVVSPNVSDRELQRLHDAGARAVRFILAHKGGLSLEAMSSFSARVKDLGWHLQFLLRPSHLLALESSLMTLPSDFVIDHLALIRPTEGGTTQPAFQTLLRLFQTGRCWVKLSGAYRISAQQPPYRDVIPLVASLLAIRTDRILWGSDWPHVMVTGKMPNTTDLFDLLLDWVPDEKMRNQILSLNPKQLFGF
jgi:predicted TIM-barrel fold metal-dependent hydrolase